MAAVARNFAAIERSLAAMGQEISRLNSEIEAIKQAKPAAVKLTETGELRLRRYLHERIARYFNNQELRELMNWFGVNPENLSGDGHKDKALQFVLYLIRRNKISQLIDRLRELRPLVEWTE